MMGNNQTSARFVWLRWGSSRHKTRSWETGLHEIKYPEDEVEK